MYTLFLTPTFIAGVHHYPNPNPHCRCLTLTLTSTARLCPGLNPALQDLCVRKLDLTLTLPLIAGVRGSGGEAACGGGDPAQVRGWDQG